MGFKLLSIDSSTTASGYGVFIDGELKEYGLLDLSKIKDSAQRFDEMVRALWDLLDNEKPSMVVVERMHQLRNADAFRKLCEITGAIHAWCIQNDSEYILLSPTEWRKYAKDSDEKLPRKREELKEWSVKRVKALFNLDVTDDTSDAILIGYGYISQF